MRSLEKRIHLTKKMLTKFIFIIFSTLLFIGCDNFNDKIENYVAKTCDYNSRTPCSIDLRQAVNVEFDTIYIFSEYTQLEGIKLITGINDYEESDWLMPNKFLVQDSHKKAIFMKDGKIVLDQTIEPQWIKLDGGKEIQKTGTFDGEPFPHTATLITSPIFQVVTFDDWDQSFYLTNIDTRTYR